MLFVLPSSLCATQVRVTHPLPWACPSSRDTEAKPYCLLLSVLFTDANPLCSSSRVFPGIKCALWKCLHLKVLWRSGAELQNGWIFLFFFSFFISKHQFRALIKLPRNPTPKAFVHLPRPTDLNVQFPSSVLWTLLQRILLHVRSKGSQWGFLNECPR